MSHRARFAGLAAIALLTTGLTTGLAAVPATAADGAAPVTVADTLTVQQYGYDEVDLLANDSDPDGDELAVCRFGDLPDGIEVISTGEPGQSRGSGDVAVFAMKPGTYTVTYYACDFDYLTAGTLTVTVTKAPKVKVKVTKTAKPGRLKVVNTSGFPVRFMWGSADERKPDGTRTVRDKAVVVKVQRRSIIWIAAGRAPGAYDAGVVRGIKLPKGGKVLPPGAPTGEESVEGRSTSLRVLGRTAARWR